MPGPRKFRPPPGHTEPPTLRRCLRCNKLIETTTHQRCCTSGKCYRRFRCQHGTRAHGSPKTARSPFRPLVADDFVHTALLK